MSAEVVLATHDDGVLRCYFRAADGALSQRAQIMTGALIEPTQLATVVSDLHALFDWQNVGAPLVPNGSAQALRQSTPPVAIEHERVTGTQSEQRSAALLDLIREHPDETAWNLGSMLFGDTATANRRDGLRKRLERLCTDGLIERSRTSDTAHYRYRIAGVGSSSAVTDYRKRPRASHAERERRRDAVLAYVRTHPHCTAMEIARAGLFDGRNDQVGKARSVLDQLVIAGAVVRTEHEDSPITFAAAQLSGSDESPEPEPEPEL